MSDQADGKELARRFEHDVLGYTDTLCRAAFRMTRHRADAEDLVQETMVRAFKGFAGYVDGTNLRAWLFRIMTNTHIENCRKRSRHREHLADDMSAFELTALKECRSAQSLSAELEAMDRLPNVEIREALESLSDAFRLTVYYADVEGCAYKEIAAITHAPLGTVMSRLYRGRRQLRRALSNNAT